MTSKSKSFSKRHRSPVRNDDEQVHLITGASESLVADSERKNRLYAVMIVVRIVSLFVVLFTDGWVQIAVFVTGMLAPWAGVQIANTLRQVQARSIETVPPQRAALEAAAEQAHDEEDTVIVGDVVPDESPSDTTTPSATPPAPGASGRDHGEDNYDKRS